MSASATKLKAKTEKSYVASGGKNVDAIPWEMIIAFLKEILSGLCPAPSVKSLCKKHPVYAAGELRRELMDQEDMSRKEAGLVAKAAVDTVGAASVADLENL